MKAETLEERNAREWGEIKASLRVKRIAKKVWHKWLRRNWKETECQD